MSHEPGHGHARLPWVGFALASLLLTVAILGPFMSSISPLKQDLAAAFEPAGRDWLLGTDYLGRSVLARVLAAAPLSMGVAVVASGMTAALGTLAGLLAASSGGWTERFLMGLADLTYAIPSLLLVLLAAGLFGGGIEVVLAALVLARWPAFARACYPLAQVALSAPAAEASLLIGFGVWYRMRRHAWPAVLATVASLAALGVGANVLAVSALGFIGIGLAPPRPEWGAMVADALPYMREAPIALLAPAGALFLATLAATLIGEAWAASEDAESVP